MSMIDWWKKVVFENYANFEGRARRSEFWYFQLFNFIISFVLSFVLALISESLIAVSYLFSLAVLIPSIAVGVRRLHDTNRSGWWMLIGLVPLVGAIVLIYFFASEGTAGPNQYGPDPKVVGADSLTDHLVS